MFSKMKIVTAAALSAASLLAALPAGAMPTAPMVKDVHVSADVSAIANPEAARYFARIAPDLEAAIEARLADHLSADLGSRIVIDIDELALSDSFKTVTGLEDAVLAGKVVMTGDPAGVMGGSYDVSVSTRALIPAQDLGKSVVVSTRDEPVYYKALVESFAESVAAQVK